MLLEAQQAAVGAKLLPFMLYSLGVVALFYVFRRSLAKLGQRNAAAEAASKLRAAGGHDSADAVAQREWLRRYRQAHKLKRGAYPEPAQREVLSRISAGQQRQVAR